MVVFMGHALLLGRVGLNVDDIANAVRDEVCRQFHGTMLCTIAVNVRAAAQRKGHAPLKPRLNMSRVRAL
jgi:hypothetical protein